MSQSNHPLEMAERYFKQQLELYGDELYIRSKKTVATEPSPKSGNRSHPSLQVKSWGTLDEFRQHICECQNCPLGKTRTHFVFGVGNPHAKLVLVGEAPGAEEDARGEPFVGRAGQLLNKILEAIQFKREDVYICNILKCRPPNNRDPLPDEVSECEPYLQEQLKLIQPKVILALGRIAGNTLLKKQESLTALRGKVHDYQGIKLIVTYHPAALLRNPHWKKPTWEDIQFMKKVHDESLSLSK
jgi:DNA polymerase